MVGLWPNMTWAEFEVEEKNKLKIDSFSESKILNEGWLDSSQQLMYCFVYLK